MRGVTFTVHHARIVESRTTWSQLCQTTSSFRQSLDLSRSLLRHRHRLDPQQHRRRPRRHRSSLPHRSPAPLRRARGASHHLLHQKRRLLQRQGPWLPRQGRPQRKLRRPPPHSTPQGHRPSTSPDSRCHGQPQHLPRGQHAGKKQVMLPLRPVLVVARHGRRWPVQRVLWVMTRELVAALALQAGAASWRRVGRRLQ